MDHHTNIHSYRSLLVNSIENLHFSQVNSMDIHRSPHILDVDRFSFEEDREGLILLIQSIEHTEKGFHRSISISNKDLFPQHTSEDNESSFEQTSFFRYLTISSWKKRSYRWFQNEKLLGFTLITLSVGRRVFSSMLSTDF